MYDKVKGGTLEVIQGIDCWIPPVGFGVDRFTGELVNVGVYSRSPKKSEQKWERIILPADYAQKRLREADRQKKDPDFFDPELESIRERHWMYRRCGFWFMNNGKPVYITGSHWLYINWCLTNIGYVSYRNTDRKVFYCAASVQKDPRAGGLTYVSRRRGGKTYIAAALMIDNMSTGIDKIGGMQSKTDTDAQIIFSKIVNYFVNFPHFFQPVYDTSQGIRPKKELRFFKPTIKGKKAAEMLDGEELRSTINYGSSEPFYYDGNALFYYILDEFGKPQRSNVWDTWNIVRYCMDQDGKWVGKAFVSSTIEDLKVTGAGPKAIWNNSNQKERDANGRTASGLYRIFFGAHESTFFDEYGNEDSVKGMEYYTNQRKGLAHDPRALASIIRKNPFTVEEAFRIDGDECLFDSMKLNDRIGLLGWKENVTTKGDFIWEDGVRDSKVKFVPNSTGRWEVIEVNHELANKYYKRGDAFYPHAKRHVIGVDPFDHIKTEDNKMSSGAICVYKKYDSVYPSKSGLFVAKYCYRPETPQQFYEEVIKAAVFYDCDVLFENQKIGIQHYMTDRGYYNFLMWLPERSQPGIAAHQKTTQHIAELWDVYIKESIDKMFFKDQIEELLEFDTLNTTKFDLSMAGGYALIGDTYKVTKNKKAEVNEVTNFFKAHKVGR